MRLANLIGLETTRIAGHRILRHVALMLREQPNPLQYEIYRRMTPERRLAISEQLYWSAREMKSAWLRQQHPEWSEPRIKEEVTRLFRNAST
jgi:hypothetical protein